MIYQLRSAVKGCTICKLRPKDAIRAIRKKLTANAGKNYTVVMYTLTVSRLTACNLISLFYIFHLCEGIGDVCQELWPTFSCASSKQRFSSRFGQNHRSKVRTTSECARKSSQSHSGLTSSKSSTCFWQV